MKLTLKNGVLLDVGSVEESYYPRNEQGVVLSIRMHSDDTIETLREVFTPAALESVTVGEGDSVKTITGYTLVDSIRKIYGGDPAFDTAVDLRKAPNAD